MSAHRCGFYESDFGSAGNFHIDSLGLMNPHVDLILSEGCGRCALYQTPDCKVHTWREELALLRDIIHQSELVEEVKWSQPCYTLKGKNVLLLFALKDWCGISFFKGALIRDEHNILESQGEHQYAERVVKFMGIERIEEHTSVLHQYIAEAIKLERAGAKVSKPARREPMPSELEDRLACDSDLKAAWDALTPGRQRSYILHVGGAKQSKTRVSRVERCMPKICAGKGFNER